MNIEKVIIVGAGTSGWLTALFLNKTFPEFDITVIASSDIGILGAGEGSTPTLCNFLDKMDISVADVIRNADATIKHCIKFTNWNGDGQYFYHYFVEDPQVSFYGFPGIDKNCNQFFAEQFNRNKNLDEISFTSNFSENNLCGFIKGEKTNKISGNLNGYNTLSSFSLHFNANKLASYFKSIALERGVKFIDDEVVSFSSDEDLNITSVITKNGIFNCDFIFDCSGFRKLLIGDFYSGKFISYKNSLPMKKAIPFFIPHENKNIPAYTESIAMKYGWMWKIPVRDRYGCGYTFDSDYINEDQALQEVVDYLGLEVSSPKTFSFEAGYYQDTWINNCVAIGLSSGFIEPLEATSIASQIQSLSTLEKLLKENKKEEYNSFVGKLNQNNLDFIYFHYLTKRNDTEFWQEFRNKNKMPKSLNALLKKVDNNLSKILIDNGINLIDNNNFSYLSYLIVGSNADFCKPFFGSKREPEAILKHKENIQNYIDKLKKHEDIINEILQNT